MPNVIQDQNTIARSGGSAQLCNDEETASPGGSRQSMAALLADTAMGDRNAFRRLYHMSADRIFGTLVFILRDREIAADVAQETYVAIWKRADRFDPARGDPFSWMCAIARNRAIDRLRAERVRGFVTFAAEVPEPAGDAADTGDRAVAAISVKRCLAGLKPEYRTALELTYFEGYTHSELAEVLDVPIGTAKSWVRRGLIACKEEFG